MAPPIPKRWTTHPEYIDLLNYLIQKAKDAKSPMNIMSLAKEFKEKSRVAQTVNSLMSRIASVRTRIYSFEHIDTKTKVKMMFALSASVDASFLERMKKEAIVEVDDKKRITHFKAKNGSLEFRGDHSLSAKTRTAMLESRGSLRSLINSYFENKNNADAIPRNEKEKEMENFIEFITEKCHNVNTPLNILKLAIDFNKHFGISVPFETIRYRIAAYCREIQNFEFMDTHSKVKQLFGLSVTLDSECLKELRKNAQVEVDEKNRITYYKATNGSLELRGDHSRSAKNRTAQLESKGSLRSLITNYFEKKKDADAVPSNKEESEIWQLIEFITEKCQSVDSPLNIYQLTKIFNQGFELSVPFETVRKRIRRYGREIQTLEFLDTPSKVKQLFGLSATLDSECLKKLRRDAVVEVDNRNRITKYTANDGSMTLRGGHSSRAKGKLAGVERKKRKNKKHSNPGDDENEESENEDGYSEEESDQYSGEEFGSEFNSDDEIDPLDKPDHMDSSNEALDFDNETPIRNRSPADMTIDDNFDFDPPSEKTHRSEETERGEDEENDSEVTANASVKTRYGRLCKKRHLHSEFSYNLANSRTSATLRSTDSSSSKPAKQKKIAIEASNSSNQSTSSSIPRSIGSSPSPSFSTESEENIGNQDAPDADGNPSEYPRPRVQEMDDYDYNQREDNIPESSPIDNQLEEPKPQANEEHNTNNEVQNTDRRSDTVAPEPKPEKESLTLQNNQNSAPQTNGNEFISVESHIRFLESLIPMMTTLDTPTLEEDQLRIEKTIEKFKEIGNEEEKIRMNEIRTSLMTCLLIVERSAKQEIVKREDTTSLDKFLTSFYQFLVALKMKELDSFVARVKHVMKELKVNDKKFPTKKTQLALQSIIEIIAP